MPTLALPGIEAYAEAHTSPEPPYLAALAEETRRVTQSAQMMVGPLEGGLLAMLVAMLQAQRVLEIGTFTGYSALAMAAGLPPGGRIVTLELDPEHATIARRHVAASPYAGRVEVRLGPALQTLATLEGPFDFVFVDADKGNYASYYEAALAKLSPRGTIAVDNVLWSGQVLEEASGDADARAIRAFNAMVVADERVECVLLPVRDGVTLIRRR
ncbi:MAG: class I SAM-dependent methyltransferase [Dehalococcoidia bacterium]|nr:class I SAM-dependent methyltransferase [Dehalococcoidia bacterium]